MSTSREVIVDEDRAVHSVLYKWKRRNVQFLHLTMGPEPCWTVRNNLLLSANWFKNYSSTVRTSGVARWWNCICCSLKIQEVSSPHHRIGLERWKPSRAQNVYTLKSPKPLPPMILRPSSQFSGTPSQLTRTFKTLFRENSPRTVAIPSQGFQIKEAVADQTFWRAHRYSHPEQQSRLLSSKGIRTRGHSHTRLCVSFINLWF